MPPTSGATMNSQTWLRASPPTMRAGPRLRAGLTEVPVMAMPIRWTITRVKPMTSPAVVALAVLAVTPRITNTNKAVKMTSHRKAPPTEMWILERLP